MNTKNLLKLASAIALAACFSAPAQAGYITGTIDFTGPVTPRNDANKVTTLNLATKLDFQPGTVESLGYGEGDYAAVPHDLYVTYNDINFKSFAGPLALWSFDLLGKTYSFDLENLSVVSQTKYDLNLSGDGTLKLTGLDNTPATWFMNLHNSNGNLKTTLSFSTDNSANNVPEPMALGLLGIGVSMLAAKRKSAAKAA